VSNCRINRAAAADHKFNVNTSAANIVAEKMSKLMLLMVLMIGALCVEGRSYKGKEELKTEHKWKRDNDVLRDILEDEAELWGKTEMQEEELLELRQASGDDSDDTDDSDDPDESPEDDGSEIFLNV